MKKKLVLAALCICLLSWMVVDSVNAANQYITCTIKNIGAGNDGVAYFALNCPTLATPERWCCSSGNGANKHMAAALTALSLERSLLISADPTTYPTGWLPIDQLWTQ